MTRPPTIDRLEAVIGEARKRISSIVDRWEVQEFCISLTDSPVAAKKKGCDEVVVLYRAKEPDEALVVADALAKAFLGLLKSSNKSDHVEEAGFGDRKIFVCLAVWYRETPSW